MTPMSFHFLLLLCFALLVETAAIIPCYCKRCLMKHHFTRNVSALETSGILLGCKWLTAVFGQEAVDIGNIVYLCLMQAQTMMYSRMDAEKVACRFDELDSYRACKVECERELDSGCL